MHLVTSLNLQRWRCLQSVALVLQLRGECLSLLVFLSPFFGHVFGQQLTGPLYKQNGCLLLLWSSEIWSSPGCRADATEGIINWDFRFGWTVGTVGAVMVNGPFGTLLVSTSLKLSSASYFLQELPLIYFSFASGLICCCIEVDFFASDFLRLLFWFGFARRRWYSAIFLSQISLSYDSKTLNDASVAVSVWGAFTIVVLLRCKNASHLM